MKTYATKEKDIKRQWHLVDAKGEILGRISTRIAELLIGKNKPYFVPYLDCGDYVVVINASQVKVSGKKEEEKIYFRHSGYPGGLKAISLKEVRKTHLERLIIHAVSGMLPKNKLREKRLRRLFVFPKEEHPYKDKFETS